MRCARPAFLARQPSHCLTTDISVTTRFQHHFLRLVPRILHHTDRLRGPCETCHRTLHCLSAPFLTLPFSTPCSVSSSLLRNLAPHFAKVSCRYPTVLLIGTKNKMSLCVLAAKLVCLAFHFRAMSITNFFSFRIFLRADRQKQYFSHLKQMYGDLRIVVV